MDLLTGKYALDIAAINFVTKQYDSGGYVSLYGAQGIGYLDATIMPMPNLRMATRAIPSSAGT